MRFKPDAGLGLPLWERFLQDPKYLAAKKELQKRYGLPLPYDIRWNFRKWRRWLGTEDNSKNQRRRRGEAFLNDVHALLKRYEIPETWYPDFIADIAGKTGKPRAGLEIPKFNFYQNPDGDWKWECIITPETDLTDPFILGLIQSQQKEYAGAPPKPGRSKKDRRKRDWRPAYEWYKRHPLFSIAEIAEKIGYAPKTVRRRFRELAKDSS